MTLNPAKWPYNMTDAFAPKGEEQLRTEIAEDFGIPYEGNEELIDKAVARSLRDEEVKGSLHKQKTTAREAEEKRKALLVAAGLDPETGKKIEANAPAEAKNEGLNAKDVIALRDVHEEDVDYLLDEAKLRGKSVAELKKDPYMKAVLKVRAEERATAEATSTASSPKRSKQNIGEKVLTDLEAGVVPETEEGGKALAEAQFKKLLNKGN